jgi:hypothetical protein
MKSFLFRIVLVVAAGLTFAEVAAALGAGGGTVNGLTPTMYQPHKDDVSTWMGGKLATLPPPLATVYGSAQGTKLVQDTLDCALPMGTTWMDPNMNLLTSGGLMTGAGWPSTMPFEAMEAQIDDVQTCLITRLNFFGDDVRIFLSGPDVRQQPTTDAPLNDPNNYPYAEAVWVASFDDTGDHLDVWPLGDLESSCAIAPGLLEAQIKRRVCGDSDGGACGVTVQTTPLAASCSGTDGEWTCTASSGRTLPAIATRLGPCAWQKIYLEGGPGRHGCSPSCRPPPNFPSQTELASLCADPMHP